MKFLDNLLHHKHDYQASFSSYDEVKNIINRVLSSEENINLLLIGPLALSKTQFLMEIMKAREGKTIYFDATNTTNCILQVRLMEKPEIILLDELDKLPRNLAEKLLGFLESGWVKVDQKNCQMDFELKGCKVFATANEVNRLSKPLQSRFRKLFLPRYTEGQFSDMSEKVLPKTSPSIARYIGRNVWKSGGDIRDVINIVKLVRRNDGPEEIAQIVNTIFEYGEERG